MFDEDFEDTEKSSGFVGRERVDDINEPGRELCEKGFKLGGIADEGAGFTDDFKVFKPLAFAFLFEELGFGG